MYIPSQGRKVQAVTTKVGAAVGELARLWTRDVEKQGQGEGETTTQKHLVHLVFELY